MPFTWSLLIPVADQCAAQVIIGKTSYCFMLYWIRHNGEGWKDKWG